MTRISIQLSDDEREALFNLAQRELRALPDQARYILRSVLLNKRELSLQNGKSATSEVSQAQQVNAFAEVNP